MTTQELIMLRTILLSKPEQLTTMNLRRYDSASKGRTKIRWSTDNIDRLATDFRVDAEWAMRHSHDPSQFSGFITMPSNCTNNECPFYTGRVVSFTFAAPNFPETTTWLWDASDTEGYDTGCEDHAWLTETMKVVRNY